MDTNKIKRFATEARNLLKAGIAAKMISLGFDRQGNVADEHRPRLLQGGSIWNGQLQTESFFHQWISLASRIKLKGINEVYEEAAYTWFNRLCAIRILQKNNLCAPILDYADAARTPVILDEARQGHLPPMKEEVRLRLAELLDDDTKTTEQFAVLIMAWCHANSIINACFGSTADYTELLLPNNILAEGGFLDRLNHTEFITDEDYRSPELIGWLYQFYISERKDEVYAAKGKFTAEEIPAATQIFTPNWIVKYMVQNSLGRIYLDNNPYSADDFKPKWRYLVEPAEPAERDAICRYDELTDLKVADLACGSGHILGECFDLLYDLYIDEGYSRSSAIESIFRHNLIGIDIDTRAKQLATFSLLIKACQKDSAFADAHSMPRVLDMPQGNGSTWKDILGHLVNACQMLIPGDVVEELLAAFRLMDDAHTLGSIMKFDVSDKTQEFIKKFLTEVEKRELYCCESDSPCRCLELILALTDKYHVIVMNPPYMGGGRMCETLSEYVKKNYLLTSNDLGIVFIDVSRALLEKNGKCGMINQATWLTKPTYKLFRKGIIDDNYIGLNQLLLLGPNTFDEIKGEVVQSTSFVFTNGKIKSSIFYYLKNEKSSEQKRKRFLEHKAKQYVLEMSFFKNFDGYQVGFWISPNVIQAFRNFPISSFGDAKQGLKTGDNKYFIKNWHELSQNKWGVKWFPVETGGKYRKWFGNRNCMINWYNDGEELRNLRSSNGRLRSRPQNLNYNFKEGITWSTSAGDNPSFRISLNDCLFESSGSKFFLHENNKLYPIFCAYLNSKVCKYFIDMFSPGLGISEGAIKSLPFLSSAKISINYTLSVISISRQDWDAHETSWDFKENELVRRITPECDTLEKCLESYKAEWEEKFMQLHANEEELNRQFIEIYGLQDELTPDVPLDEVTILQQGEISIEE